MAVNSRFRSLTATLTATWLDNYQPVSSSPILLAASRCTSEMTCV